MLKEEEPKNNQQKELSQLRKTNPNLVKIINERLEIRKPSQEYQARMLQLFESHEESTITEKNRSRFDLLEWLKQVLIGMRNLRSWVMVNSFLPSNIGLVGNLLIIVSLFAGLYLVYYQYINSKQKKEDFIVNQHSQIKVLPSPINTPALTSIDIQNTDPKIVKSSNDKENNKMLITNRNKKLRKPEEPKSLYKENDKISLNIRDGNYNNITSNRVIKTVYVGYLGDIEEVESIDILLKNELKDKGFELFNSEDIGIDKADIAVTTIKEMDEEYLILTNKNNNVFFKKKLIELTNKPIKEKINLIVEEIEKYKNSLKSKKGNL